MRALAQARGIANQVRFLGSIADLPQLLMRQRIFVLSTHYEGMPLALVEGMAAGCACVASGVVGVNGVLEQGRTGLLVPESDAPALAQALAGLLTDESAAARLGQAARAAAEAQYGLARMHSRYQQLLENVHARSGH